MPEGIRSVRSWVGGSVSGAQMECGAGRIPAATSLGEIEVVPHHLHSSPPPAIMQGIKRACCPVAQGSPDPMGTAFFLKTDLERRLPDYALTCGSWKTGKSVCLYFPVTVNSGSKSPLIALQEKRLHRPLQQVNWFDFPVLRELWALSPF